MARGRRETGIALLISIFVLLLISVVAIALIVSSGTESALAGNYRSSTGVYYAALAGLEEARERLLSKNPNSFNNTAAGFLPSPGTTLAVGTAAYVLNPSPTDNQATMLTTYQDSEYITEFGSAPSSTNTTLSVWNTAPLNALNIPGPLYKWVRINAVSEKSLKLDVGPAYDGYLDPVTPIFYDGSQLNVTSSGAQVLEITALAVLPNGSQKLVQYLTAPTPVSLPPLPSALTLAGSQTLSRVAYTAPSTNAAFKVDGTDHDCNGNPVGGPKYASIGVFDSSDTVAVITGGNGGSGIPNMYRSLNYPGFNPSPDIRTVNGAPFPTNLQKPSALDGIAQSIIQNADVIITPSSGPALGSDVTSATTGMSSTNPMTVVINGDLDLNGWHNTGYGLLLVTGNFNYDPDASWYGIILVMGKGTVTGSKGGSGLFLGAFLVASTRDSSGNLWPDPNLGALSVNFNNGSSMGGNGILYSNCWIQKAQPTSDYKILSFHEISQ